MSVNLNGDTGVSKVQDDVAGVIPIGGLIDFAGSAAPANYLALPLVATNISRTTYAKLFAAIGTTWGVGDGSTTFGMPYLPANQTTVQANANVGTTTVGEVITHTHSESAFSAQVAASGGGAYYAGVSSGTTTGATGGTANLPAGVRVLKCVRYQ